MSDNICNIDELNVVKIDPDELTRGKLVYRVQNIKGLTGFKDTSVYEAAAKNEGIIGNMARAMKPTRECKKLYYIGYEEAVENDSAFNPSLDTRTQQEKEDGYLFNPKQNVDDNANVKINVKDINANMFTFYVDAPVTTEGGRRSRKRRSRKSRKSKKSKKSRRPRKSRKSRR